MAKIALSLREADDVFDCAERMVIQPVTLTSPTLQNLDQALSRFYRQLGAGQRDPLWTPFWKLAFAFMRGSLRSPLPYNHPAVFDKDQEKAVKQSLYILDETFPDRAPEVRRLLDQIAHLAGFNTNPFLDEAARWHELNPVRRTAFVLSESKHVNATRDMLQDMPQLRGVDVICPNQCRGTVWDRLVLFGQYSRYPSYLTAAPRGRELIVIQYKWRQDVPDTSPAFVSPIVGTVAGIKAEEHPPKEMAVDPFAMADPLDWVDPTPDSLTGHDVADPTAMHIDHVEAKAYAVEGGAAFLRIDAMTLIIDLNNPTDQMVKRLRVPEIQEGMFLLLRAEEAGDYLVPVADQFLGGDAPGLRRDQADWKRDLRHRVVTAGLAATADFLQWAGGPLANPNNIRNWISETNICTREVADFAAILTLLGRKGDAGRLWDRMQRIRSAHRAAGHAVHRLLLEDVRRADLRRLQYDGTLEFTLSQYGVTLKAYRVVKVHPGSFEVPPSRMGRLLRPEV